MAEKSKKDEKKKSHHKGGEMAFGLEVLLFVLAVFVIWVLTGGNKKQEEPKPFITPLTDEVNPGRTYDPGGKN